MERLLKMNEENAPMAEEYLALIEHEERLQTLENSSAQNLLECMDGTMSRVDALEVENELLKNKIADLEQLFKDIDEEIDLLNLQITNAINIVGVYVDKLKEMDERIKHLEDK